MFSGKSKKSGKNHVKNTGKAGRSGAKIRENASPHFSKSEVYRNIFLFTHKNLFVRAMIIMVLK
jgi:hypothetical protein